MSWIIAQGATREQATGAPESANCLSRRSIESKAVRPFQFRRQFHE